MSAVGTVYVARALISATALKLYVCAVALFALARLVWVERVFTNFSQVGLSHTVEFFSSALLHTDTLVQLTLAVLALAGVSLVRDLLRSASAPRLAL